MWRGKERQNRYAKKREVEEDLHTLKINHKGKKEQKGKERNKCRQKQG